MSIIRNTLLLSAAAAATGYQVSRSLRFNSSDSGFCSRTPASTGNRRTWTWSGWVKRSKLGIDAMLFNAATSTANSTQFRFKTDDKLRFYTYNNSTPAALTIDTLAVFRDTSAWYHIVAVHDTTQSQVSDMLKIYVNGILQPVTTTGSVAVNTEGVVNTQNVHEISRGGPNFNLPFDGYLADINFIDGQALTPSSFTEVSATTGQLIPKAYTGTFTGNSFWLPFSDNSSTTSGSNVGIGKDFSGLGNYWNTTNLSVTAGAGNDSLVDTPTSYGTDDSLGGSVRGNYCTWNPVASGSNAVLTNGNLDYSLSGSTSTVRQSRGTFLIPTSGKWYWEHTITVVGESNLGVVDFQTGLSSVYYWYSVGGFQNIYINGSQVGAVAGYTNGDIIGIGYDSDNQQIRFYKNGSQVGSNYSLTNTGQFVPYAVHGGSSGSCSGSTNFGQRPFAYPVSGFKALCDTNLPAPVVAKPNTLMDVLLWSGTGGNRSFSSLNMSPDFVWIKQRNQAYSTGHQLYDIVRGAGSEKELNSSGTGAEGAGNIDQYGWLSSFDSNGFSVTAGPAGAEYVNASGVTYAAWCWDAGSSNTTNNSGTITGATNRVNASAGFSIITYTGNGTAGATIGHGLGAAPQLIIIKRRDSTSGWNIYTTVIDGSLDFFDFSTGAKQDSAQSVPTNTVFSVSNGTNVNANGGTYVAYAWAPVTGLSRFGIYTGNGSSDGPFVYTGFRPRWVMIKRSDSASSTYGWFILDTARNTYNVMNTWLAADNSAADGADIICDTLANGFKIRTTAGNINTSAGTFLYACFAESPFAYSRAR